MAKKAIKNGTRRKAAARNVTVVRTSSLNYLGTQHRVAGRCGEQAGACTEKLELKTAGSAKVVGTKLLRDRDKGARGRWNRRNAAVPKSMTAVLRTGSFEHRGKIEAAGKNRIQKPKQIRIRKPKKQLDRRAERAEQEPLQGSELRSEERLKIVVRMSQYASPVSGSRLPLIIPLSKRGSQPVLLSATHARLLLCGPVMTACDQRRMCVFAVRSMPSRRGLEAKCKCPITTCFNFANI
ncbi:uncharacterized protein LOC129758214 [Uranotaenia lowii]|uniref:uncharacterized protein LOC129758214 n=1 Tax=Uranotaenia lowii TaxID=190385 RepID=UPI0024786702|nr:uncharacterized protein LOC129758214 [Uranotaenia lowii]